MNKDSLREIKDKADELQDLLYAKPTVHLFSSSNCFCRPHPYPQMPEEQKIDFSELRDGWVAGTDDKEQTTKLSQKHRTGGHMNFPWQAILDAVMDLLEKMECWNQMTPAERLEHLNNRPRFRRRMSRKALRDLGCPRCDMRSNLTAAEAGFAMLSNQDKMTLICDDDEVLAA